MRLKFRAAHGSLIWFVSGGLLVAFAIIMAVMSVMNGLDGEGLTHIAESAICLVVGGFFLYRGWQEKKVERAKARDIQEDLKNIQKNKKANID